MIQKKNLEMGLYLFGVERLAQRIDTRGDRIRALVHVGQKYRGAYAGLRVETRAPVAVPARADLEIEGAVNPILLRPEY